MTQLERKEEKRLKKEKMLLLKTAFEYERFLQKNKLGTSFSTFVDEFGFDTAASNLRAIYEKVNAIRECAYNMLNS